ncbi:MAG: peroxidase-related enzyme [Acidimicrobiia bacterium]|nr:peroxidase-related enzyme [Acidimicrobiia bacterium]
MNEAPISRYPIANVDDLPNDLRDAIRAIEEKTGFIPNVFLAMGHRPDEMRAFMAYHDALMERESGLTKAEREMIVVATSGANDCLYCVVAHGAIVRIRAKDSRLSDQLATNHHKADITERQKVMLDFALKVSLDSASINDEDFMPLRDHGFSDEDIWDIAGVSAFFAMSNRMANFLSMRPNDEFYSMARG